MREIDRENERSRGRMGKIKRYTEYRDQPLLLLSLAPGSASLASEFGTGIPYLVAWFIAQRTVLNILRAVHSGENAGSGCPRQPRSVPPATAIHLV